MTEPSDRQSLWQAFCRDLEAAGDQVINADFARDSLDEAEGIRYLTRLLRIGLDMHLENADPAFPSFYQASHATAKIGADNPDNYYQNATISGDYSYRIWGKRGNVPILSFGTKANRYAVDGTMASTGELDIRDVGIKPDGSFEIIVSREQEGDYWLPISEDSSILIVRQTFFDRIQEEPAEVYIETIDGPKAPALLSKQKLEAALESTTNFVAGTSGAFCGWADLFRQEHKNALSTTEQSMFIKAGGDPMIYYLHGWWELAQDEGLRITTEIPECEGWNFQVNNVWMESLDYRHNKIHVNNSTATEDPAGKVTVIVSAKDPGHGNWIDTCGHTAGTMLWRWTGAHIHPVPKVEVISL